MPPLKFIIALPDTLVRTGVSALVAAEYPAAQIHYADDAAALRALLPVLSSGVVVTDYAAAGFESVDRVEMLRQRNPSVRWVHLLHDNQLTAVIRLAADPSNVLVAAAEPASAFAGALHNLRTPDGTYVSPGAEALLQTAREERERIPLTATELEILALVAQGLTVAEMAERRCSSVHTIITHKKNIFRKLGVTTIHEATQYALRSGLVAPADYTI